jgi:hypothetical protein
LAHFLSQERRGYRGRVKPIHGLAFVQRDAGFV